MSIALRIPRVLVLSLALMTVGCATPRVEPPPLLSLSNRRCEANPNWAAASTIAYDPSKHRGDASAEITSASACFEDAVGQSLYAVYRLPSLPATSLVRVESTPQGQTLMAPRVLLYGPHGRLKRQLSGSRVVFRGSALSVIFRSHADERYLVVASDPAVVGHAIARIRDAVQGSAIYAYPYIVPVYTGADATVKNVLSYNGRVTVALRALPAE